MPQFNTDPVYLQTINDEFFNGKLQSWRCCDEYRTKCNNACLTSSNFATKHSTTHWAKLLYILIDTGYTITKQHFTHFIACITLGTSKSLLIKQYYTCPCIKTDMIKPICKYMFDHFDPSKAQLKRLISCYKKGFSQFPPYWIDILVEKGFVFTKEQLDLLATYGAYGVSSEKAQIKRFSKMSKYELFRHILNNKPSPDLLYVYGQMKGNTYINLCTIVEQHKFMIDDSYAKSFYNLTDIFAKEVSDIQEMSNFLLKSKRTKSYYGISKRILSVKNKVKLSPKILDFLLTAPIRRFFSDIVNEYNFQPTIEQWKKYFTLSTYGGETMDPEVLSDILSTHLDEFDLSLFNNFCQYLDSKDLQKIIKLSKVEPNLESIKIYCCRLDVDNCCRLDVDIKFLTHMLDYKIILTEDVLCQQTNPETFKILQTYGLKLTFDTYLEYGFTFDYALDSGLTSDQQFYLLFKQGAKDWNASDLTLKLRKENKQVSLRLHCMSSNINKITAFKNKNNLKYDQYCVDMACQYNKRVAKHFMEILGLRPTLAGLSYALSNNKSTQYARYIRSHVIEYPPIERMQKFVE